MPARTRLATLMRWLWDPRVAVVIGTLLLLASAIAVGLSWPLSRASIRPAVVGAVSILRGLALPGIRRRLHRWTLPRAVPRLPNRSRKHPPTAHTD